MSQVRRQIEVSGQHHAWAVLSQDGIALAIGGEAGLVPELVSGDEKNFVPGFKLGSVQLLA